MGRDKQIELLQRFVKDLDKEEYPLSQGVIVADTFSMVEDEVILRVLQETIKKEYNRMQDEDKKEAETIYGLLAGMFGKKAVFSEDWFEEMSKKYDLPDITEIPSQDLFNPDGVCVQQYFFYNDKDGENSYRNFIRQYTGRDGWTIQDRGNYALIKSTGPTDKKIEIYANKPKFQREGQAEIEGLLKDKSINVIVHRGHSFHVDKIIHRPGHRFSQRQRSSLLPQWLEAFVL